MNPDVMQAVNQPVGIGPAAIDYVLVLFFATFVYMQLAYAIGLGKRHKEDDQD